MTSVPEFGEPVEILLPLMSATDLMPESLRHADLGVVVVDAGEGAIGCGAVKAPLPATASAAVSAREKATS